MLFFFMFLTAAVVLWYAYLTGYTGPSYARPFDFYLTEWDKTVPSDAQACFTLVAESEVRDRSFNISVYVNAVQVSREDDIFIQGPLIKHYCYPVGFGGNRITLNFSTYLGNSSLQFNVEKTRALKQQEDGASVNVTQDEGLATVTLYNGYSRDRAYLISIDGGSKQYVTARPFETVNVTMEADGTTLRAASQAIALTPQQPRIELFWVPGLVLFALPGLVLFRRRTFDELAHALMFSLASFLIATIILNYTIGINFITVFVSWLIVILGAIAWTYAKK